MGGDRGGDRGWDRGRPQSRRSKSIDWMHLNHLWGPGPCTFSWGARCILFARCRLVFDRIAETDAAFHSGSSLAIHVSDLFAASLVQQIRPGGPFSWEVLRSASGAHRFSISTAARWIEESLLRQSGDLTQDLGGPPSEVLVRGPASLGLVSQLCLALMPFAPWAAHMERDAQQGSHERRCGSALPPMSCASMSDARNQEGCAESRFGPLREFVVLLHFKDLAMIRLVSQSAVQLI